MKKTLTIREIATIGLFTALTAILAQISLPLPFTPVPFSCGLAAVYITGLLLRPKQAVLTQICYLLLGALGLPVFSGFRAGLGTLVGPTGGYLWAYPIMAAVVALTLNNEKCLRRESEGGQRLPFIKASLAVTAAQIILYAAGTAWLGFLTKTSFAAALALGAYPFAALDLVKMVFCVLVIVPLRARLHRGRL